MLDAGGSNDYRYGYQGSEKENEIHSGGYSTEYRILDVRIGRWFSPDPITHPWQSPYCSMDNNPVALNDVLGLSTEGSEGNEPTKGNPNTDNNPRDGHKYEDPGGNNEQKPKEEKKFWEVAGKVLSVVNAIAGNVLEDMGEAKMDASEKLYSQISNNFQFRVDPYNRNDYPASDYTLDQRINRERIGDALQTSVRENISPYIEFAENKPLKEVMFPVYYSLESIGNDVANGFMDGKMISARPYVAAVYYFENGILKKTNAGDVNDELDAANAILTGIEIEGNIGEDYFVYDHNSQYDVDDVVVPAFNVDVFSPNEPGVFIRLLIFYVQISHN